MVSEKKASLNGESAAKVKKPRKKESRPRGLPFDDKELRQVEKLAGLGFSTDQIADFLEISRSGFYLRKTEGSELEKSFLKGKANGAVYAMSKLFELIGEKNVSAIIFYLKTQCQWKAPNFIEHTGKDGEPIAIESEKKVDARELLRNVLDKIVSPTKEL